MLACRYIMKESESEVAQSCPTLCDPWTVAHKAPPSMGFSRQEYWSGLPFPSPVCSSPDSSYLLLTIQISDQNGYRSGSMLHTLGAPFQRLSPFLAVKFHHCLSPPLHYEFLDRSLDSLSPTPGPIHST